MTMVFDELGQGEIFILNDKTEDITDKASIAMMDANKTVIVEFEKSEILSIYRFDNKQKTGFKNTTQLSDPRRVLNEKLRKFSKTNSDIDINRGLIGDLMYGRFKCSSIW
jgi:hypothetical protein